MNKVSVLMFFIISAFVLCTSQLVASSIAQPEDNKNSSSPSQLTASVGRVGFFDNSTNERIYYGTPNQAVYVETEIYGPLASKIEIDIFRDNVHTPDTVRYQAETEGGETINVGEFEVFFTSPFLLDSDIDYNFGQWTSGDIQNYYVRITVQSRIIYGSSDATLLFGRLSMLDPYEQDYDRDSLSDGYELNDGDTLFNDSDTDDDGLMDGIEVTNKDYDPLLNDTDGDGFLDGYEYSYGFNPMLDDSSLDLDGDGLTNLEEYNLGTYPNDTDTDGDGLNDSYEVKVLMSDPKNKPKDQGSVNDGKNSEGAKPPTEASPEASPEISFHLFSLLIFSPIVLAVTLILSKRARNRSKIDKI